MPLGRAAEIEAVRERSSRPGALVTLLGPPGIGKTTVLRAALGEGSIVCELELARTPAEVLAAIGTALGVGAECSSERVALALEERGAPFVGLDNVEHVIEEVAALLRAWRARAPRARFVLTSREPLAIDGEAQIWIGPLERTHAIRLFIERAVAAGADPAALGARADAIARVVDHLDGVPLALELAASRARWVPLDELLEQDPLELSRSSASRERPPRQATLEAALEWSYALLDERERDAFADCAVFEGPFSIEQAGRVSRGGAPVVARLVERSLISSSSEGLRLFAAVRAFAASKATDDGARARHAELYVALVLERGSSRPEDVAALTRAWPNARVALRAMAQRDPDRVARALLAASAFVATHVSIADLDALADACALAATELRARLHVLRAKRKLLDVQQVGAASEARRALDLGGASASARALLAMISFAELDLDAASRMVSLARRDLKSDDREGRGLVALVEGLIVRRALGAARALPLLLEADGMLDDDPTLRMRASLELAWVLHDLGHDEESLVRLRSLRDHMGALGAPMLEARIEALLGSIEVDVGRAGGEERLLDAHKRLKELGDRNWLSTSAVYAALSALDAGDAERAERWLAECSSVPLITDVAVCVRALAAIARGDVEVARRSLEGWVAGGKSTRNPHVLIALCHVLVGDEAAARRALASIETLEGGWSGALRAWLTRIEAMPSIASMPFAFCRIAAKQLGALCMFEEEGRWFRAIGQEPVTLARRHALRRIALAIARAHPLGASTGELVAEGWPGEKLVSGSGRHRLHTAVTTLRAMGLRVEQKNDRYHLAEGTRVVWVRGD